MKIKYFLRGLGMGIIFSALLLTIVGGGKKEVLTEEEIITRASLLGMVRPGEIDLPETTKPPAVTETPEATQTPPVTETPKPTETPEETKNPAATKTPETTKLPAETETPKTTEKPEEYVTLTIRGGMTSKEVARALEAAGLVSDAEEFDDYLCDKRYAAYLTVGKFKIRVGADFKEIAEEITK